MTKTTEIVEITSAAELRELVGTPGERAVRKVRGTLHPHHRAWIAASPYFLLATCDGEGRCDVSPKGDPPGSVLALDDRTLAIPDRPGNRRLDSFLNVLSNPGVALLFLVPGRLDTLRVNGRARLVRDAPFFDDLVVQGHRPTLALLVEIEEVYFHCPKASMRSALWQPETWPDPASLPSTARLAKEVADVSETLAELERHYAPEQYDRKLYGA
ncbi:MAG TPA: pyridoxamine 5'-phosphate oxidase family protein [Candidatus Dormibacteraeota bacterium]|nr:pyridoxamine 5'-phosphate oxidase family protein [Candidatus Dormibacteraeota bacterium]